MKKALILKGCRWCALTVLIAGGMRLGAAAQSRGSASTTVLTLADAVRLALADNPEVRAAGARVVAAGGRAFQAKKWPNPELELSAEDWPVSDGRGFSDAKQTIGLAQTLPYPGKKSLDQKIGSAGVKLSEAELALRRTMLVRDVKAAFFQVLSSDQLVEVSAQLVAVAEASAATARKRVEAGAAAFQEQLRGEVQWEQARTELAGFQRDAFTARQVLAALLGRPDLSGAELTGALAEAADASLLGETPAGQLAPHPSLSVAQANLDQAQLAHRRARLEPYPDVKVGVAGGWIGESDQSIIQMGFSLPLPLIDRGKGKQEETRANVIVAEAELHNAQQQLHREWRNAHERYRTAAEQVAGYQERILPKAEEALRLVRIGFEQGKFVVVDLLDTQRTTAQARLDYQQKLLELNLAQAELEALLRPEAEQP